MSYGHIFQALELNFSIFSFECYVLVFKSAYEKKIVLVFCCKRSRVKYHNDIQNKLSTSGLKKQDVGSPRVSHHHMA